MYLGFINTMTVKLQPKIVKIEKKSNMSPTTTYFSKIGDISTLWKLNGRKCLGNKKNSLKKF
jgi:hypothetical protein